MAEKEFRRDIRAIEADAETRLGRYLPDEFRRIVASHVVEDGTIRYYDGDPGENEYNVQTYREFMEKYVEAVLSLDDAAKPRVKQTPASEAKSVPSKIYRKTFERRLHLLDFVLKRKGDGRARRGFWKATVAEWNHEHPHDQRTPEDLKTRYSEYVNNSDLWNSYVAANMAPVIREAIMASASLSGTGKLTCSATVTKAIRETPLRVKEVKHDRKHNEKR